MLLDHTTQGVFAIAVTHSRPRKQSTTPPSTA